jgi:hypothetical protein
MNKNKVLFLQVDIMEKFRKLTYKYPNLVSVGRMMMQASEKFNIPLYMIEANKKQMGETAKEILEVKHKNVKQFEKFVFSAYEDPKIRAAIDDLHPDHVVIYGLEAHACVLLTSLDLLEKGYGVHLVVDGVSSINKLDRSVALSRLQSAGVTFTTSESLLLEIVRDSKGPEFKPMLELIKAKLKVTDPITEFI